MSRTPKQMFLDMAKGIQPDRLLQYCYMPNPYAKYPLTCMNTNTSVLAHKPTEDGKLIDIWGVPYVTTRETGFSPLPEPGVFILKDISEWRDVIKAPDISNVDWKAVAEQDLANLAAMGIDREQTAIGLMTHLGYFQQIMSFMGFEEGLCALFEDPEEMKALVDYMSDFYCTVLDNIIDLYKPDFLQITDDLATWKSPFMSLEQYREIFLPAYKKLAAYAIERNIPIAMHCCGNCTMFIDDWLEMGVTYWDPAQLSNDLVAIQKKYGDKLVICGGFDMDGELSDVNCTEERYKELVREAVDKYTKHGMYVFDGWLFCDPDDAVLNSHNRWLTEEVEAYGLDAYKRNRG
ncbi:MAG: veratrol--corrinoid protein metyltransferase [Oscillospiraceae bacterium]|nr:veratrol--corrinoid protein metyltransferase [Oscillospiraceae bacterium]